MPRYIAILFEMKLIDIKFSVLCFFALLCFIYLNINMRKTEIVQFEDPDSEDYYNGSKIFYFVISNPPENKDSLLDLVSNHFQSFTQDSTIEKYIHYNHEYYKETWFTHRSYYIGGEKGQGYSFSDDYIDNRRGDLLVRISVSGSRQEIVFYRPVLEVEKKITIEWKEK